MTSTSSPKAARPVFNREEARALLSSLGTSALTKKRSANVRISCMKSMAAWMDTQSKIG